jgi:hypothetical protein
MGLDDVYKLVFQAAMGATRGPTRWPLARPPGAAKWDRAPTGLVDPISGDGGIVRVHLHPFLRRGLRPALSNISRTNSAGRPRRSSGLRAAARLAREGALAFSEADVDGLIARMRAAGFPAVHHTDAFTSQYRPAYRIVASTLLPREFLPRHEVDGRLRRRGTERRPV